MVNFLKDIVGTVLGYLKADWWILFIGVLLAVCIKVYIDDKTLKKYMNRNFKISIVGSIGFGAFTPLCACGTMAVILSMFISSMPWGPVMAFLVSSPLTSPSEFMFQTAFFSIDFAIAVLVSSIMLGLSAGIIAHLLDIKTDFFKGQISFLERKNKNSSNSCNLECTNNLSTENYNNKKSFIKRLKIRQFINEFINLGIKKVLLYFIIFIVIGRIAEIVIPQEWIISLFSEDKIYSIPLGATIGLPLYVSGPASLPLMKSFMNSGAGKGVLLAFLITGKATGVPVIAGMSTLLKKRAIMFYVLFVYLGGIVFGAIYQLLLNITL